MPDRLPVTSYQKKMRPLARKKRNRIFETAGKYGIDGGGRQGSIAGSAISRASLPVLCRHYFSEHQQMVIEH
jgi:hypothetical protein